MIFELLIHWDQSVRFILFKVTDLFTPYALNFRTRTCGYIRWFIFQTDDTYLTFIVIVLNEYTALCVKRAQSFSLI